MNERDDHDGASQTYPNPRHQIPIRLNGFLVISTTESRVHNHPSGDPKPARKNIEMAREIKAAAEALGIAIHDHVVIGRKGHASFRSLGLM